MKSVASAPCGDTGFTLAVTAGAHPPARIRLEPGATTVGTDIGNSVVLLDDELSPVHFELAVSCDDGSAVRLVPVGGDVVVGRQVVAPGNIVKCRSGMTFRAGSTTFAVIGPKRATAARKRRGGARPALAIACAGTILSFFALPQAVPRTTTTSTAEVAQTPAPVRALAGVDGRGSLERRLAAIGLREVGLTSSPDGSVEAKGEILPEQATLWHDAQSWFDAEFGGRIVLVNHVAANQVAPLAIRAVWPGPDPYVIDERGEKLFKGAPLKGGWVVDTITSDRVLIRRGDRTIAVRF